MKYDAKMLKRYGIDIAPIDDTMLMSYAMHAGEHNHGMDALSERYSGPQPHPHQITPRRRQIRDHI